MGLKSGPNDCSVTGADETTTVLVSGKASGATSILKPRIGPSVMSTVPPAGPTETDPAGTNVPTRIAPVPVSGPGLMGSLSGAQAPMRIVTMARKSRNDRITPSTSRETCALAPGSLPDPPTPRSAVTRPPHTPNTRNARTHPPRSLNPRVC